MGDNIEMQDRSDPRTPMRAPKLTRWQSFKRYMHNSEEGTYMGRTSNSWGKWCDCVCELSVCIVYVYVNVTTRAPTAAVALPTPLYTAHTPNDIVCKGVYVFCGRRDAYFRGRGPMYRRDGNGEKRERE